MSPVVVRPHRRPLHRVGKGGVEVEADHGGPRPEEQEGQGEARRQEGNSHLVDQLINYELINH